MNKDILPQGNNIRQLLVKSNISDASINVLLKGKGVFLGQAEKNDSVPLLMKTIISPDDFENLYETQKAKEESFKHRTVSIDCGSDFALSTILKAPININEYIKDRHTYRPNYKVIGNPSFYFENKNRAVLEYKIERENLLNDWTDSKTYHKGSLLLTKGGDGEFHISVQKNSTSKETLEVNNIVISHVKSILQKESIIDKNDNFNSIRFNNFDNANRIKFLYSFANNFCIYVKFISLTDINLYLDPTIPSHADIEKFLAEIENLKLRGKELQKHIFIKSNAYHPKLLFSSINLRFEIEYKGVQGYMNLNISFPDYIKRRTEYAELQTQISFSLKNVKKKEVTENKLRNEILPFIESLKILSFNKFKKESFSETVAT